jgi:hypothetical protein
MAVVFAAVVLFGAASSADARPAAFGVRSIAAAPPTRSATSGGREDALAALPRVGPGITLAVDELVQALFEAVLPC